jgi:hypothetical protein
MSSIRKALLGGLNLELKFFFALILRGPYELQHHRFDKRPFHGKLYLEAGATLWLNP